MDKIKTRLTIKNIKSGQVRNRELLLTKRQYLDFEERLNQPYKGYELLYITEVG